MIVFVLLLIPIRICSDSAVMCEHKCFRLLLQPGGATKPQEAFLVCLHPPLIVIRTSWLSFNLPQQTSPTEKKWPLPGSWLKWESTGVVVCFTIAFIWLQELCVAGANPGCAYSSSCWSRISWVCECSTDIKANRLFGKNKRHCRYGWCECVTGCWWKINLWTLWWLAPTKHTHTRYNTRLHNRVRQL